MLVAGEGDEDRACGGERSAADERHVAGGLGHHGHEAGVRPSGREQLGGRIEQEQGDVLVGDEAHGVATGIAGRERGDPRADTVLGRLGAEHA